MSTLDLQTARVFVPLLEPARDKAAWGGRGSGKSHFFAELLIEDSLAEPGESGEGLRSVCIREVQKDLAQSSKLLIETKLNRLGLSEADGFKVFKDVIQTPGDGLIIFKGMNDYTADSIKSLEASSVHGGKRRTAQRRRASICCDQRCARQARRCGGHGTRAASPMLWT